LDKKDFKLIFDTHFESIKNYIFYRIGDIDMATDLAQDVFVKIWEKQLDLDPNHAKYLYKQLKTRYESALQKLPEKQRTVFMMSRMEELKYTEIAQLLDISIKTVEKRMSNALFYLRKALVV
jgi:RNA polymerase sigma-70 factor (ECF subfamily)